MSTPRIDIGRVKAAAAGRWPEILSRLAGIDVEILDGKHHACPKCGGTDRFRFDIAREFAICNKCLPKGGGDGLAVLMWATGWDFPTALARLADQLGVAPATNGHTRPAHHGAAKPAKREPTRTYPTADEAIAAYGHTMGEPTARWDYPDRTERPVGYVLRWDRAGGRKEIRPLALVAGGWAMTQMPAPRPIYHLLDVLRRPDEIVYVVEGEKCAERLAAEGRLVVTSAGGAKAAAMTDWSALAGRDVVILPDHDEDETGEHYAADVAGIVTGLAPAARVKTVRLPGLNDGEDVYDWLKAGHTIDDLDAMVKSTEPWTPVAIEPADPTPTWRPFPTDALPPVLRQYCGAVIESMLVDAAYPAVMLLGMLAGCINGARWVRYKPDFKQPCILWTMVVARSGTMKTNVFNAVTRAISRASDAQRREHRVAMTAYHNERELAEKAKAAWKADRKSDCLPPVMPEPPRDVRLVVKSVTIEKLAVFLQDNPKGLLLSRDELSSAIAGMGRYSANKGAVAELAEYIEAYEANALIVDRIGRPPVYAPRAAVSITGGIQPDIVDEVIGGIHHGSGFFARFLLARPPEHQWRDRDASIPNGVQADLDAVVDRLLELQPDETGPDQWEPAEMAIEPAAKAILRPWFNGWYSERMAEVDDRERAHVSKLRGGVLRLAGVLHLTRWASGEAVDEVTIDRESMAAAIAVAEWFADEVRRLYQQKVETPEQRDRRELVEVIERQGGRLTAQRLRELRRTRYGRAVDADEALTALARDGIGHWQSLPTGPKGGRPSRVFVLGRKPGNLETPVLPHDEAGFRFPGIQQVPETLSADATDHANVLADEAGDEWGEV